MIFIAVNQRVDVAQKYEERRDALDQRWSRFLYKAGILPILVPNDTQVAAELLRALRPGMKQHVRPGDTHRFTGLEESEIIEFSTHHVEEDSYRNEPSGRVPEAEFAALRAKYGSL